MTGAYARLSKYACTVGNRGVSSVLTSTQPRHTTVESLSAWADSSVLQPGSDKARYRNYYLSNSDVPAWQLRVHKVRPGTSGRHVIPATRAGSVQWKKPRKERLGAVGQAPAHHQPRYPHLMFPTELSLFGLASLFFSHKSSTTVSSRAPPLAVEVSR